MTRIYIDKLDIKGRKIYYKDGENIFSLDTYCIKSLEIYNNTFRYRALLEFIDESFLRKRSLFVDKRAIKSGKITKLVRFFIITLH